MKVSFLSFKSLLDNNSGAALEIKTVLEALSDKGIECSAISLNCYDIGEDYAEDEKIDHRLSPREGHGQTFHYDLKGVRHYLYVGSSKDTVKLTQQDYDSFIRLAISYLEEVSPDIVIFFGSNELLPLLKFAKSKGAKVIFYAGTASYQSERKPLFDIANTLIVPTEYIGRLYEKRFGKMFRVIPTTLPFCIDPPHADIVLARRLLGKITLVNPTADKGGHFFFRLASNPLLCDRPFLCVESRGTRRFWRSSGINIDAVANISWAPWQSSIKSVLSSSAVLLIPSLVEEAAGKVIAEAMALGVPCIGFDIGGIGEQIGKGGVILPFDNRLAADLETSLYQIQVVDEPINLWANVLHSLLTSHIKYESLSKFAVEEARRFLPEFTVQQWYEEILSLKERI